MQIICTVDIRTRELSLEDVTIAAFDHLVDDILFDVEPIDGFELETSTIKIAAVGPLGEPHDYEIDPSTVTVDEETGNTNFIWSIPVGVTAMPLSSFKINDVKKITFAVCAEIVSGDNLVKAWHSNDGTIKVKAHLEPESGGGEDPSEEATNAQKIAALQRQVGAISSGAPPAAESTAEMDPDISTTYINKTDGHLYFWDGSDWQIGGIYGANIVDDTVSEPGMAAEAAAVRAALNAKADADGVTALDTRVAAVEGDVDDVIVNIDHTFVDNAYIYSVNTGSVADVTNIVQNTSFCYLLIPVTKGYAYTFTASTDSGTSKRAYMLMDSEYNVIVAGGNGTAYADKTLIPEQNGCLVINAKKAQTHSCTEYAYPLALSVKELDDRLSEIEPEVEELSDYFVKGSNILNPEGATDGIVITSEGTEKSNTAYMTSDYIPVEILTQYTVKCSGYLSEYTSAKAFLRRSVVKQSGTTITTQSTATYVRASTEKSYLGLDDCRICKGSTVVDEPYYEVALADNVSIYKQAQAIEEEISNLQNEVESTIPSFGVPYMPPMPYHYSGQDIVPYKTSGHLSDIYSLYDALLTEYPQYIHKEVIGTDASGQYEIRVYKIGNGTNYEYRLPRIVWLSSIHGNEGNTTISTYYMVKELLENFATDPNCYAIMSAFRLYVIPAVNPWGVENYSRLNANNVNLNRNFPADWVFRDPDLTYGTTKYGISSASNGSNAYYYYGGGTCVYDDSEQTATTTYVAEPETQAIMTYLNSINTGANLHGKIAFAVNKHDSGSMSQEGATIYIKDNFESDRKFIKNLIDWFKAHLMGTQNWLTEKSGLNMGTVSYSAHGDESSAGTMDKWLNAIGVHGCLCEIPKDAGSSYTDTQHYADLCAINVDFGLSLIANVAVNNAKLKDNTQTESYEIVE